MSINFSVRRNALGTSNNPYYVVSESSGRVEFDELVRMMAAEHTIFSAPEIAGILMLFKEKLTNLLAEGKYVKTPFGAFHITACGSFKEESQAFTPGTGVSGHGIRMQYRPGSRLLQEVTKELRFVRTQPSQKNYPVIMSVELLKPGTQPDGILKICGRNLQFDETDPSQGIFIMNDTEHHCGFYLYHDARTIFARFPAELAPGQYDIELHCKHNSKTEKIANAPGTITLP